MNDIKTKIILSIILVLFANITSAKYNIEDKIQLLRVQFEEELRQKNAIKKLDAEQELIDAHISIISSRRNCEKLGIDCKTGKEITSVKERLIVIEEEKTLINAFVDLEKTKTKCKKLGIDCKTGVTIKQKKTKVIKNNVPTRPNLIGYLNNTVLLTDGDDGDVIAYRTGEELASGYKIKKIIIDRYIILEYNTKLYRVY